MITPQLPLLASILAVVCITGWMMFRRGGSWDRARRVIEDAQRDVATWSHSGASHHEDSISRKPEFTA
ncbi:MAG TPA: hypothetical protein VGS19_01645 [Streptosporangiaceae bacterium]|nr:hypothetical protein [Streptosporangiaceae bacterium]